MSNELTIEQAKIYIIEKIRTDIRDENQPTSITLEADQKLQPNGYVTCFVDRKLAIAIETLRKLYKNETYNKERIFGGLTALDFIKNHNYKHINKKDCIKIIDEELTRKQELEFENNLLRTNKYTYDLIAELNTPKLKALNIIISKLPDMAFIKSCQSYDEYIKDDEVKWTYKKDYILTEKEYDLLKKVLI